MSDAFDPYYIWLGIPPEEQPPNHYRLLGVTLFEDNSEVIEAAANRQMAYMQEISAGDEHIDLAQKILGELSRARICLLNSEKKADYDAELLDSVNALVPPSESLATPPVAADEAEQSAAATAKKQASLVPIIAAVVVTLLLIGGGLFFYLSGEAKKQEEQQLAQVAEKKWAEKADEEAAQRQAKQARKNAERKANRNAAREAAQEEANRKAEAEDAAKRKAAADKAAATKEAEKEAATKEAEKEAAKQKSGSRKRQQRQREAEAEAEAKKQAKENAKRKAEAAEREAQELRDNPDKLLESKGFKQNGKKWVFAKEQKLKLATKQLVTRWKHWQKARPKDAAEIKTKLEFYNKLLLESFENSAMRLAVSEDLRSVLEESDVAAALVKLNVKTTELNKSVKALQRPDSKLRKAIPKQDPIVPIPGKTGHFYAALIIAEKESAVVHLDPGAMGEKDSPNLFIFLAPSGTQRGDRGDNPKDGLDSQRMAILCARNIRTAYSMRLSAPSEQPHSSPDAHSS